VGRLTPEKLSGNFLAAPDSTKKNPSKKENVPAVRLTELVTAKPANLDVDFAPYYSHRTECQGVINVPSKPRLIRSEHVPWCRKSLWSCHAFAPEWLVLVVSIQNRLMTARDIGFRARVTQIRPIISWSCLDQGLRLRRTVNRACRQSSYTGTTGLVGIAKKKKKTTKKKKKKKPENHKKTKQQPGVTKLSHLLF